MQNVVKRGVTGGRRDEEKTQERKDREGTMMEGDEVGGEVARGKKGGKQSDEKGQFPAHLNLNSKLT